MSRHVMLLALLGLVGCASTSDEPTLDRVDLARRVCFLAPDGKVTAAEPGSYRVCPGPDGNLVLDTTAGRRLVVRAVTGRHSQEDLAAPVAVAEAGAAGRCEIVLFLPGGEFRHVAGTMSVVLPRRPDGSDRFRARATDLARRKSAGEALAPVEMAALGPRDDGIRMRGGLTVGELAGPLAEIARSMTLDDDVEPKAQEALNTVVQELLAGDADGAEAAWAAFLQAFVAQGASPDVGTLTSWVLKKAYVEPSAELRATVEQYRSWQDLETRKLFAATAVEALKAARAEIVRTGAEFIVIPPEEDPGDDFSEEAREALGLPAQVPPPGCTTPDDLDAMLETWDEELQTVGEDAQLANVDMQNMLQKQQQTMQMMSQISKMLHDTAMAVIRKMGG